MSVDVLDPSVRVTITEEPLLFKQVLRAGNYHSDFVVDAMERNQMARVDEVYSPITEAELDDFVGTYNEHNQVVSDEEWFQLRPSRMRRLWNWLTRKHVSEEE